ncbi:MAG TPA: hypothetical protein VMJ32_12970 [Pirellulales bacterium]|nr:hypothetical protein [Pirellulales bacterium]
MVAWSIFLSCALACADEPKATESGAGKINIKVEKVLSGLNHPCGVAVRPETEYVYVAEAGSGQIAKFAPANAGKSIPAIVGFPTAAPSANSAAGSLYGLAFLSRNELATLSTTAKDDKEEAIVSVFELPTVGSAGEDKPLDYAAANRRSSTILSGSPNHAAEPYGISLASFDFSYSALLISARRGDDKAGVYKADVAKNRDAIDGIHPLFKSGASNNTPAVLSIAVNPHGLLVAVQAESGEQHRELTLAFYQVRNGSLIMSMPLALTDVVSLAYSPESGRLYALSSSPVKSSDDGLYRLDAGKGDDRATVKAVKLAGLERPSGMAFSSDNTLYVSVLGAADGAKNDDSAKQGKLLKITGDL